MYGYTSTAPGTRAALAIGEVTLSPIFVIYLLLSDGVDDRI